MRFRRNTRMLGGILDAAPIASVFFLIVIFVMLGPLAYTPGIHVELPAANDLPGTDKPTVTVAVDAANQLYYAYQHITESELKLRLASAVTNSPEPLTLVVKFDKNVPVDYLTKLTMLGRDVGIQNAMLATQPTLVATPNGGASRKP